MTYIKTGIDQPGIIELLQYKESTGKALSNLANTLFHGPSALSSGERELIAVYVSNLNECEFCRDSHMASANVHFQDDGKTSACVIQDSNAAPISEKMKALLQIASKVQKSGRAVQLDDIENARKFNASDEEIHDAVLIAAAFCMFNRYVDGLATQLPKDKSEYIAMGERMAKGY